MTLFEHEVSPAGQEPTPQPPPARRETLGEMTGAERREQVIRARTIAGIHLDTHVADRPDRRWLGAGAMELAAAFDPEQDTARHCAALLYFLDWNDAKWLFSAGISMEVVQLIGSASAAFQATHDALPEPVAGRVSGSEGPKEPSSSMSDEWWSARRQFMAGYFAGHPGPADEGTVFDGNDLEIIAFGVQPTYEGWVEGYPNPRLNQAVIDRAMVRARSLSPYLETPTYVVRSTLLRDDDPAARGAPDDYQSLPSYSCVGRFASEGRELLVVWFCEELPVQESDILGQVGSLPWHELGAYVCRADDYD